jgi:hypothetical protein
VSPLTFPLIATLIRWEPLDHASQRVVDCDWAYSQGLAPLQDQLNAPPFVEQLRLPIKVVLLKKIERGSYKRLFLEMGWSGNARGKAGFSVERRSVGVR